MSAIAELSPAELRVFAEIARASENGVCNTPATVLWRRCGLTSAYMFNKQILALEEKGLVEQVVICNGVPREIRLVKG